MTGRTVVAHLTTTDMSLDWLLGPQLVAFREAGYEVVGISALGAHVAALEAAGIRHVPLHSATRSVAPLQDVRAVRELWRVLRELRPTILHTHNPKPGIFGRLAGRLAGVPIIVNTQHGVYATPDDPAARRFAVYAVERLAAACSDAELVQNEEDLRTLQRLRVPTNRLTLLGNGVDLTRFDPRAVPAERRRAVRAGLGIDDEHVLFGFVGRLVAEKGVPELLEAARRVRGRDPRVRVALVGPHDTEKADAVDRGLLRAAEHEGVLALGERRDVVQLYAAFDVLVLPSHREGMPRAVMEAAAMGVPAIVTDVRGCRQVVEPGVTGLVVPPRDAEALAAAMTSLADDASGRARLGGAARERALARFDQEAVIATTLRTYDALLRERFRLRSSS